MRFRVAILTLGLVVAFSALTAVSAAKPHHASQPVQVRFELSGPAIGDVVPAGRAQFQANGQNSRLVVQVRHVELKDVTLDVVVDGTTVGQIVPNGSGNGRLVLQSRHGDQVAALDEASLIEVRNSGDGSVVLSHQ